MTGTLTARPSPDREAKGKAQTMTDREIQDLVDTIADTLQVGVSLDDMSGHLVAYSAQHGQVDDARVRALLKREVPADVLDWEVRHGVRTTAEPIVVPPNEDLGMLARICVPLLHRGVRTGLLWALQADDDEDAINAGAQAIAALKDRTDLLAVMLYEAASPQLDERRERETLFYDSCRGDRQALDNLAATTPRRPGSLELAVIVPLPANPAEVSDSHVMQLRVATQQVFVAAHPVASAVQETHSIALFRGGAQGPQRLHREITAATQIAEPITTTGLPGGTSLWHLYTGISSTFTDLDQLPHAYQQAVKAAQVAAVEPLLAPVVAWDETGPYRLLAATAGRQQATTAFPLYQQLRDHDPSGELLTTLEVLYDHGDSIAQVAVRLHLHRTSLYYRIGRIKDIIGTDPLTGWARLEIHNALKAARWDARPKI